MATVQTHIIRKQQVIARYTGQQADAFALQQQLANLLSGSRTQAAMETVLAEFSPENEWLILDKIDIDIGPLPVENWEDLLLAQLKDALHRKLFDAIPDAVLQGKTIQKSSQQFQFDQLVYFLENGYFEYNFNWLTNTDDPHAFQNWAKQLIEKLSGYPLSLLETMLLNNTDARQRFLSQLPVETNLLFLQKLMDDTPETTIFFFQLRKFLSASNTSDKQAVFAFVLSYIGTGRAIDLESIKKDMKSLPSGIYSSDRSQEVLPAKMIFVQNAGVVLLHPYVFTCFDTLSWLEKGQFKNELFRQKAMLMWHYLATGKDVSAEYELPLPKVLSGLHPHSPFTGEWISLSEAEKAEGERLLRAAIAHWKVLKNTSLDGLREEFLQREGKLCPSPFGGYTLTVEKRSSDVLLSKLPWAISLVKLEWMKEILYTDWI